jgi:hypothetical protein
MARGEARAATRTSPRGKKVSTRTNGVAAQVSTNRSKAAEKRKKVRKKAAARSTKRAKPNDAENGYDDKPVEDVVENPVNANEGVISNKMKRVAGAGKKRKSIQPKKALVQSVPLFIDSTSESEEYVDEEEDDAEEEEEEAHEEEHAEQEDAIQDSSDDGQKETVDDNDSADLEQQDSSSSSSEGDNSGDRRRRYSEYQKEMNAEAAAVMAEDRRKELNRSAQQGSVDPPNNANPNAMLSLRQVIDVGIMVRGLSKAESLQKQEKHVANRVIQFVKSDIFRRIKFINNDAMFQKAFLLVMNHEKVEPHKRVSFQMLYESCFNHALNTKRSSCEQAGGILARNAVAEFKQRGELFYSIDEFCKLRRATTEREKRAFFWFFDSFLECVCGARPWRNAKKTTLVSKADDGHRGKLVTKSDEAFALLLIDNYMEKWISALAPEENMETDAVAHDSNNGPGEVGTNASNQKKKGTKRIPGKYTAKKNGHCKYGGWSRAGTARFNELYSLVQEDRASPQSEQMEHELMVYCRAKAEIDDGNAQGEQEGQSDNNALEGTEVMPVEAAWDLDD